MLIKSLIKREGGSHIQFGQEGNQEVSYHFKPKAKDGDHVCDVTDKKHIQQLLSIQEGYEIADDEPVKEPKAAKEPTKHPKKDNGDDVLQGSDWNPTEFEYGEGKTVSTKDLVEFVFLGANVSKEVWNAMSTEQIEEALDHGLVQYAKAQEPKGK